MSNDLQTKDKQNQEVDSSEQYAIKVIGEKTLQSADYVVKEGIRALDKAIGGKPILARHISNGNSHTSTLRQAPAVESAPSEHDVHTSEEVFKRQEDDYEPVSSEQRGQYHTENQGQFSNVTDTISDEPVPIYAEQSPFSLEKNPVMEKASVPTSAKGEKHPTPQKAAHL